MEFSITVGNLTATQRVLTRSLQPLRYAPQTFSANFSARQALKGTSFRELARGSEEPLFHANTSFLIPRPLAE
jgi:hypothetical protein